MLDGGLRDFMKYDTIHTRWIESKRHTEMPSDRLSFAVLIGRYPYFLCFFSELLEFGDTLFLLW